MLDFLPENISSFGGEIDGVITYIWRIILAWLVATEAVLVYLLVRYRRREGRRAAWLPATTSRAKAWILVPAVFVTICDIGIEARSAPVWDEVKLELPEPDLLIRVTGRQFVWTFTYAGPDGELDTADDFEAITDLYVPRDRVVRFQLESADVLHSFWVPVLRLKQDAVPGRSIPGWFEATADGRYEIACAELCGASHTAMRGRLTVQPPEIFDAWSSTMAEQQSL